MERNSAIITTLLMAISLIVYGQDYTIPIDTAYNFIQYQDDTLYIADKDTELVHFYHKLHDVMQTKTGNVSILHLGGSHVQAGTMSHRIRTHLLTAYGDTAASRGIIFPYSAASKCNNPRDYGINRSAPFNLIRNVYTTHKFPLGCTGIAVWCADTMASIAIRFRDSLLHFESDTVILLGDTKGWPIDPILKADTLYHFPDYEDTLNDRYYFYMNKPVQDFTLFYPCSKGDTFITTGIILKNPRAGITFNSIGVNGADVNAYLRCQHFERDLDLIRPDLVIFGIGVNDAFAPNFDTLAFKDHYIQLIHKIQAVNPDCAFIFLTNNDTYKRGYRGRRYVNPNGPDVCDVMYRLADYTGGAVWNQFTVMGGLKSMENWRQCGLAQYDRVHFTATGYNLIGDLFYNAFIRELQRYDLK